MMQTSQRLYEGNLGVVSGTKGYGLQGGRGREIDCNVYFYHRERVRWIRTNDFNFFDPTVPLSISQPQHLHLFFPPPS